ncbi:hypothetical protein L210DRAFT_3515463, partial [Boletus edulis BED1]
MVSVDIIRACRVSWTRGMRWTVATLLETPFKFRVGMSPGPRQMQPGRMQWIKTERRED